MCNILCYNLYNTKEKMSITGFNGAKIWGNGTVSYVTSASSGGGSGGGGTTDPSGYYTTTAVSALNSDPNLVLWYTFDASNGTAFKNLATNVYDASVIVAGGTASSGVTVNTTNRKVGAGAANFNGTAYIITTAPHIPNVFTTSFWFYPTVNF